MPQQWNQNQVRFSPQEMAEVVDQITVDDLMKMHPADRKLFEQISGKRLEVDKEGGMHLSDSNSTGAMVGNALGMGATTAGAGILAAPAVAAATPAVSAWAGAHPVLSFGAGTLALEGLKKLGVPSAVTTPLETMMGLKTMLKSMGSGAASAGVADVEQELIKQGINPRNAGMAARGERFATAKPGLAGGPIHGPSETGHYSPLDPTELAIRSAAKEAPLSPLDVERKIFGPQGSEAAIFGARPPAYPPNVSTGANTEEIAELLKRGVKVPKRRKP